MKSEKIEIILTDEEHAKFSELCKEEGKSFFQKMDDLVHSFLTKGETHHNNVAVAS